VLIKDFCLKCEYSLSKCEELKTRLCLLDREVVCGVQMCSNQEANFSPVLSVVEDHDSSKILELLI
jgi:hypothetical protein